MKQYLVIFLCFLQIWIPTALFSWSPYDILKFIDFRPAKVALNYFSGPNMAFAQQMDFHDAAAQGQAFGQGLIPDPSSLGSADKNGITINWGDDQNTHISAEELFPDMNNTSDPTPEEVFGSDGGIIGAANSQVTEMETSDSYTGQAYRTLGKSVRRAHIDRSNEPWWDLTDQTFDDIFNSTFTDCEVKEIKTCSNSTAHVPDYRQCERITNLGGTCHCYHDYQINILQTIDVKAGVCGGFDKFTFKINLVTGALVEFSSDDSYYSCPQAIVDPTLNTSLINENTILKVSTELDWDGAGDCGGDHLSCAGSYDGSYDASEILPDLSSGNYIGTFVIDDDGGGSWYKYGREWILKLVEIVDNGWSCDPGCEVFLEDPEGSDFKQPEYLQCSKGPNSDSAIISGIKIYQNELTSNNPFESEGISNLCEEVEIGVKNFAEGQMECWIDPQGVQHCPYNPGDQTDTCGDLESNPDCVYIGEECIEGAYDAETDTCYAWDVTYDCGFNVSIQNCTTQHVYMCNGTVSCMGESCVAAQYDNPSTAFGEALAKFQAIQYFDSDMTCEVAPDSDSDHDAVQNGCSIFGGESYKCKKALGGYVNCCEEIDAVSLVDYIRLAQYSFNIVTAEKIAGYWENPVSPAWEVIDSSISSAWDKICAPWTSPGVNTVLNPGAEMAGELTAETSAELGAEVGQEVVKKGVVWKMQQFVYQKAWEGLCYVNPELAEFFFTLGPDGTLALAPGIQAVLWAYTAYQIITLLIQIIWQCEQDEFELGAKRHLKVCHYVGSYCASDVLGVCIEKKQSYCCFNSPLARILQEQIRPQLGMSWGSAKHPDCSAIPVNRLNDVDWSQVDLSEWLALLNIAGLAPDQRDLSLDGMTGSGSVWNTWGDGSDRPDALERAQEALSYNGTVIEDVRQDAWQELWGQGE